MAQRTRDRRVEDPTFIEWQAARALEVEQEKAAADAAQEAADAQNPELMFKRTADAEAQTILELLRTGYVPESILAVERINGRKVVESVQISNWKYFADTCPTFQRWMAEQLIDSSLRNDIAPVAANYLALHNLMLQYGAYVEPVQEVAPAVEEPAQQVLSRSDQAILDHHAYVNDVVGTDEMGRQWTEEAIDRELSAKDGLRLRRLFEQGHRGSNLLTIRREILDIKAQQDAERERIAAEGQQ
jgi:hypothetical protein